jgi:uncharacterized protein (TIGR02145 family)
MTKSLVDDSNVSTKEIGIQITDITGTQLYDGNSQYTNLRLTKPATSWVFDDGAGVPSEVIVKADNAKIYAYYPFTSDPTLFTGTGESAVLMADIPQSHSNGYVQDYLWSAQDKTLPTGGVSINSSASSVQLKLNHTLAMLAFVFYKSGYDDSGNITAMEMKSLSADNIFRVNKTGINDLRMKLSNGVFEGGTMVPSLNLTDINSTITLTADPGGDLQTLFDNRNFHMLLVPASISAREDLEFSFDIDGSNYKVVFPGSGALNMVAGNIYIITAKLSPKSLSITGVTDWNLIEYEVGSGYQDVWGGFTPQTINGVTWAPVNAGYDGTHLHGLIYQWHRKYGQNYNESPAPTSVQGPVSLQVANDVLNKNNFYISNSGDYDCITPQQSAWSMTSDFNPCPAGWRVATAAEFQSLISAGYTYVDFGLNNQRGYWFGGHHNTDHVGSIFIPLSGYRKGTDASPVSRNTAGYYWTMDSDLVNARMLQMNTSTVQMNSWSRSNGFSVRCVKEL